MQYPKEGRTKQIFTNGFETATGILFDYGTGTPEGIVTAPIGSSYTDTVTGITYTKVSGVGNTGWRDTSSAKISAWIVSTTYYVGDTVLYDGVSLRAKTAHISNATAIDSDINSDLWEVADGNGYIGLNIAGFGLVGMASRLGSTGGNPAVYRARITGDLTEIADGIIIAGGGSLVLAKRFGTVTLPTAIWDARAGTTGGLTSGTRYYLSTSNGQYSSSVPFNTHIQDILLAVNSTTAIVIANTALPLPVWTKRIGINGTWTATNDCNLLEGDATVVNMFDLATYNNKISSITIRNTGTANMQINPFAGNTIRGQTHMVLGPGGSCEITKDITPTNWVVTQKSDIAIWNNTKNYKVGDVVAYTGEILTAQGLLPFNTSRLLFICTSNYIESIDTTKLPRPSNFRPTDKNIEWSTNLQTGTLRVGAIVHNQSVLGSATFHSSIATATNTVGAGVIIEVDSNGRFFVAKGENTVQLNTALWNAINGGAGALTPGEYYILSQTTAGNIQVADVTSGVRQVVGLAIGTNAMQLLFDAPTVL